MYYPVYILDKDNDMPIVGGESLLEIPCGKEHFFNVVIEKENIARCVILPAISGTSWALMRDIDAANELCHDVGVLCQVIQREQADDFELITVVAECRVEIEGFATNQNNGQAEVPEVLCHKITEAFSDEEEILREDINNLINTLLHSPKRWDPNMIKHMEIEPTLLGKLDVMADYLLKGQQRISYNQAEDNCDKWNLILDGIQNVRLAKITPAADSTNKPAAKETKPTVRKLTMKERVKVSDMPAEHKEIVDAEVEKLNSLPKSASERSMLNDYVEWTLSMPWGKTSYKKFELRELRTLLDESHYGLDDVKDHIVEHMCIEQLRKGSAGAVLCFVGPPGTGKTTIAAQIAKASNRSLQRIALGGLSDEAEIRGHRRTYVGSKPGRFIRALKQAKTMDPLIVLDEVDKVARYKGDPMSALLEVLDPEQNHEFTDRYLELPVDLSQAMFICTANEEQDIPEALRDRMELIHFRDYERAEREIITQQFILPKLIKHYHIEDMNIEIDPEVLEKIYEITRLRQIEKTVGKILRMAATQIHVYGEENPFIDMDFAKKALNNNPIGRRPIGFQLGRT